MSIKKKHLRELFFVEATKEKESNRSEFEYDVFKVVLIKGDKENPEITIDGRAFIGAYRLKDLKDLLFMYYGENDYNRLFPAGKIKIKEVTYTKNAMLKAFEAGFFHAVPNMTINVEAANEWFKKEYEK
jgi:hypothetical protein